MSLMSPKILAMYACLALPLLVGTQLSPPPRIMFGVLTKTATQGIPYTSSQIVNLCARQ